MTKDKKKAKIFNALSALVLIGKICLQESQVSDTSGKVWTYQDLPLVEEDQVKEYLNWVYTIKPCYLMGCIHECEGN